MAVSQDIEDPSDWLNTSLATFLPLDNAFRCQVCKDFYDTPMLTSCSHTFCSKCIRTCLSSDGKCPTCRSADQASKLRNNLAIEEAVGAFKIARPVAYTLAHKDQRHIDERQKRPGKRRRLSHDEDVATSTGEANTRRQTRSMRNKGTEEATPSQVDGTIEIQDSDEDEDDTPEDGLVACPICDTRMKEHQVSPHLDGECDGTKKEDKAATKKATKATPSKRSPPSRTPSAKPQERLAELNYSLMHEKALRKKLAELGLPNHGPKALLMRRHTEWVNLWNANCDSSRPKSKVELLNELRKWDRAQGGGLTKDSDSVGIMDKDFDTAGWQSSNKDDFQRLIDQARKKRSEARESKDASGGGTAQANSTQVNGESAEQGADSMDTDPSLSTGIDKQQRNNSEPSLEPQSAVPEDQDRPYENNPEAMASIREKVRAANAGERTEPLMNAGFGVPSSSHASPTSSSYHESTPTLFSSTSNCSQQQAQAQGSNSNSSSRRVSRASATTVTSSSRRNSAAINNHNSNNNTHASPPNFSKVESNNTLPSHTQHQHQHQHRHPPLMRKESSLGDHFNRPPDRKMSMFRVPEDPVSDNERLM